MAMACTRCRPPAARLNGRRRATAGSGRGRVTRAVFSTGGESGCRGAQGSPLPHARRPEPPGPRRNVRHHVQTRQGPHRRRVVIAIVLGGGLWWFLRDDAPDEVSLDAAVDQVTDDTTTDTSEAATSADRGHLDRRHRDRSVRLRVGHRDLRRVPGPGGAGRHRLLHRRGPDRRRDRFLHHRGHHGDRGRVRGRPDHDHHQREPPGRPGAGGTRDGAFPTATFTLTEPLDLGAAPPTARPSASPRSAT